jgi:hypothetical protein
MVVLDEDVENDWKVELDMTAVVGMVNDLTVVTRFFVTLCSTSW